MSPRSHVRVALSAAALFLASVTQAQTHRVAKPEKVTRAIGVYEWTGDLLKPTASRLVPVSLFIDGRLEDAGVYLARPVPFALNPGYIYSVEKAGEPVGTLDLDSARNLVTRRSDDDDNPIAAWFGYGRYTPPPAAAKAPALRTTAHPAAIVASSAEGRPHLANRTGEGSAAPGEKAPTTAGSDKPAPGPRPDDADRPHVNRRSDDSAGTSTSTTPGDSGTPTSTTSASSPDDPDRPHMSRRSDTSAPSDAPSSPGTASTTTPAADDDSERPTLRRRGNKADTKRKKESGSGVTPMATSLNDDPDRPTLSHNSSSVEAGTPPLTGNPPDLRQAIAVSDASTVDSHPFDRAWESPAERASVLASFEALAKPRVANYLTLNAMKPGAAAGPASAPASGAASISASQPSGKSAPTQASPTQASPAQPSETSPPTAEDTGVPPRLQRGRPAGIPAPQSAPAPAPPPTQPSTPAASVQTASPTGAKSVKTSVSRPARRAGSVPSPLLLQDEQLTGFTLSYGGLPTFVYSARTPVSNGLPVHITVVAQQLPSGELQVALSSLTDDAHLDRSPWMRLVDVVDPNDSHRASFLFELRAKSSRQFALYNLVSSHAEQSFVTGLIQ